MTGGRAEAATMAAANNGSSKGAAQQENMLRSLHGTWVD